jgi:hypothetical protein
MATDPLMLTHVGLKRLQAVLEAGRSLSAQETPLVLLARQTVAELNEAQARPLLQRALVQPAPADWSKDAIHIAYRRNPLEHVARVNFEITTRCNFACRHCRNDGVTPGTESDLPSLVEAARLFLSLGIRRFDFIGGEITRHGTGWLELAEAITRMDAAEPWPQPLAITVYTNGWWLAARRFEAAGQLYADERDFLRALSKHGVTHVLFSIDGPEPLHDDWRGHPGLFQRILSGIPRVAAVGLAPRLSVVVRRDDPAEYLRPLADVIYGQGDDSLGQLATDPLNQFSNFIDVGRGAQLRQGLFAMDQLDPALLRCKAFFRPAPTLRIMANGEVGVCPLMLGAEAYGNIHRRPLVEILNGLHQAPLYQLHASGDIAGHFDAIDRGRCGDRFDHVCSVRVAANRLALGKSRESSPPS